MSVTRGSIHDLMNLQERMNRLFEQALHPGGSAQEDPGAGWAPAVDIEETPERIVLRADLPGVSLEKIELKVADDHLTLKGDRPFPAGSRREDYHRIERSFGSFYRSFMLPRNVNQTAIQAELKNGILEVTLPKKTESKPKQIQVPIR
ncbi:MAG TPA: Hsp20/alpha crystallin family protein [Candidatus Polarisedimenticolia bacterium]|nr:Hsp20/alpha crystallin family protein [Candidatus Polarisedimenticolia bacterium]